MMRLLRWTFVVVLLAGIALAVVYLIKDPERRRLDDHARAGVPGRFVRLSGGITHYETGGPDTGRAVVLAAGFSVPAYIWDSLFYRLADSGVRVVRYDYYGRGWSDRPDASYDQAFFVRQLAELLDSLHLTQPVDLAGLSFGGSIVTSFATTHPERVHSLLYFDPAYNARRPLPPEERSPLAWSWHMIFRGGTEAMATGQATDFLHPERHPDWVSRYRVQQQFKGTREALRRSRAAIAVDPDQTEQLRRLNTGSIPILLVWGRQDSAVPFTVSEGVRRAMPRAEFVPVDSAGHLPHLEQPEVVIGAVMRFIRRGPAALRAAAFAPAAGGTTVTEASHQPDAEPPPTATHPTLDAACEAMAAVVTRVVHANVSRRDGAIDFGFEGTARRGCELATRGRFPRQPRAADSSGAVESDMGRLDRALHQSGWVPLLRYQADGPDGQVGGWRSRETTCVQRWSWDGGDDGDSTYVPSDEWQLAVDCAPWQPDDSRS